MTAYKLTYQTTDFEGKHSTYKSTVYSKDAINDSKKHHEKRGAKLIDVEDISVK